MKEEAVSPVIAFMLLLMIVVSIISLLNAYYIPSLKQQAEIEHSGKVHQSFLQIGADINRFLTFQQDGIIQERILLGGGDVPLSPLRSSGALRIKDDGWISSLTVTNNSGYSFFFNFTLISLSYHPVGNFWSNQGYIWRAGVLNITKGNKTTWAEYIDDAEALQAQNSFIILLSLPVAEEIPTLSNPGSLAENRVIVRNMSYYPNASFISSNGITGMDLKQTTYQETILNITSVTWKLNTVHPSFDQIRTTYAKWFADHYNFYNCNKMVDMNSGNFTVTFGPSPVDLTLISTTISATII